MCQGQPCSCRTLRVSVSLKLQPQVPAYLTLALAHSFAWLVCPPSLSIGQVLAILQVSAGGLLPPGAHPDCPRHMETFTLATSSLKQKHCKQRAGALSILFVGI